MDATLPPSRRTRRVLERLGLRAHLVVERPDGSPPTPADLEAAREAIAQIDDLETRADRAASPSGARRGGG